eukprot:GFKZ01015561.1.p1 GENE.GFKZ01015561.1~~GFKZ01015561.1.p1  ORF type:complete len:624 (+),score=113.59 GFKZ01015561.1:127-1872(+)
MAFLPTHTGPLPRLLPRLPRLLLSTSRPKPPLPNVYSFQALSTVRCVATTPTNNSQPLSAPSSTEKKASGMFADGTSLQSLGISPDIADYLADMGISTPTKAQAALIPLMLDGLAMQTEYAESVAAAEAAQALQEAGGGALRSGEDSEAEREADGGTEGGGVVATGPHPPERDVHDVLMFGAETGSGKTLAYLLPYVEAVRNTSVDLKAVILVPSRELCQQVEMLMGKYFTKAPKHVVIAGGLPPDVTEVKDVRVIIATPGALLNYFRFSPKAETSDKVIVVDEADMLLSGSFVKDVERILNQPGMKPFATRRNGDLRRLNRNRLVFVGATYPHWTGEKVKSIVTWMKRRYPGVHAVQTEDIHKRNRQLRSRWRFTKGERERLNGLMEVLEETTEEDKIMVFTSKAENCRRAYEAVMGRLGAATVAAKYGGALELHKKVGADMREENLRKFRSGDERLLFCTDLGSRGLDLGKVTRVIEYEFASNVVAHLHRIGRTARAGESGRTDHFYDEVARPLAEAIMEKGGDEGEETVVEGVFSRNRSFRRKWKKREREDLASGRVRSLDDVQIDAVDEEEEERLRG